MTESTNTLDWFRFANVDLDTARHLYETMWPRPLEHICYCCQQSAEKYIKGVMLNLGKQTMKTHDLVKLCSAIKAQVDINPVAIVADALTIYATATRYPVGFEVDDAETKAAIAHAERVKEWAESIVQLPGTKGDVADNDSAASTEAK